MPHFKILRSQVNEIIGHMGSPDGVELLYFGDADPRFGMRVPAALQPLFWISVTSWYSELESSVFGWRDLPERSLPEWAPGDLADYVIFDASDQLLFSCFDLIED